MIHDPKLLIRLIVRMIVSKVQIKHAGMILYEPKQDTYILDISRGERGVKIPAGFTRFNRNDPLIQLFAGKQYRSLILNRNAILTQDLNKLIWQESLLNGGNGNQELLHRVGEQMRMLNVEACVPAKYKNRLMAILLLGKKSDGCKYNEEELDFFAALASDVAMAIRNAQLFDGLKRESEKNHDLFIRTIIVLAQAIEAKDKYTRGHTEGVTGYAISIARQMVANGSAVFDGNFFENLYVAGMLHDIGKIGVPESILNKAGLMTPEEAEIMKQHPLWGVEILKPLSELKGSLEAVKYHHERYDGSGYPEGLKGEEIPIIAAIISVADAYDAMITDRPYRAALSKQEALNEIRTNLGSQFPPKPARALIELAEMGRV